MDYMTILAIMCILLAVMNIVLCIFIFLHREVLFTTKEKELEIKKEEVERKFMQNSSYLKLREKYIVYNNLGFSQEEILTMLLVEKDDFLEEKPKKRYFFKLKKEV